MSAHDESRHDALPVDSDIEVDETAAGATTTIHLRPAAIALVALGGAIGTAAREGISLAVPSIGGVPVATLGINIVGALLLGLLLETLVRRGADHGRRRMLRLLLSTGALGGFTTYSALALDTATLLGDNAPLGVAYALGTVLIGGLATWAGIALGATLHRRRAA